MAESESDQIGNGYITTTQPVKRREFSEFAEFW